MESEQISADLINVQNNMGNTALYYASKQNNLELVAQLVSMDCVNPFVKNNDGEKKIVF